MIDTLCLCPGYVETKMISKHKQAGRTFGVVSVTDCVSGALRDLGYETVTFGPLIHEIWGTLFNSLFRYLPMSDRAKQLDSSLSKLN